MNTWSKVEELVDFVRTHDIKELKDYWSHKEAEDRKNNTILWILAIIGAVAAVAAIAYAVYRYMTPDYPRKKQQKQSQPNNGKFSKSK